MSFACFYCLQIITGVVLGVEFGSYNSRQALYSNILAAGCSDCVARTYGFATCRQQAGEHAKTPPRHQPHAWPRLLHAPPTCSNLPKRVAIGVLVVICVFVAGFAWSWGPLGWLVPSEIQVGAAVCLVWWQL